MKYLLLFLPVFIACNSKPDLEKERKTILSMLQRERKAHFSRKVEMFMSEFADSMISVNKGVVSSPSKEENKKRIGNYFGSVQFIKWDDVAEPIIRFSDDGSLAYAIVQKNVIVTYPGTTGKTINDTHIMHGLPFTENKMVNGK
jgi:hypothetical protein